MEELARIADLVRRAALQGARSFTSRRQVVQDATTLTIERWEQATIRGKQVANWEAWAFRVAANAAKRAIIVLTTAQTNTSSGSEFISDAPPGHRRRNNLNRRRLREVIILNRHQLTGRQFEVALKLCEPGMSLHRAAKELLMDRRSLRRSFRSAIARLTKCRECPPLLLIARARPMRPAYTRTADRTLEATVTIPESKRITVGMALVAIIALTGSASPTPWPAQDPFPEGCTAKGEVIDGEIYWDGCPSNACGGSPACQVEDDDAPRWSCFCDGGSAPYGKCQAKVNNPSGDSIPVGSWSCVKKTCTTNCNVTTPPPNGEFYFCSCSP